MQSFQLPSPLEQLESEFLAKHQVEVFVKRDDLIHPEISGNKWRKLKYNFQEAKSSGFDQVLTFGGAHSNHLIATAVAAKLQEFKSIGVVRGEEPKAWSETLKDCRDAGMILKFISREDYKLKNELAFQQHLAQEFGESYIIPEGGANYLGSKGCGEIIKEITEPFDYVCCAAGTGTTAAGILNALIDQKLLVVSALKGGEFLRDEILKYKTNISKQTHFELLTNYHFGGYAKINQELVDFVNSFYKEYQIKLDLVYTTKLFFAMFDLIKKGFFPKGAKIVVLHSGGLQGNRGFLNQGKWSLFDC